MFKIFFILFAVSETQTARILIINPTPSFSHQIVIRPIVKALAGRGHDIVFITPRPMKNKQLSNVREIDLSASNQFWKEESSRKSQDLFQMIFKLTESLLATTREQMRHPDVQNLIQNKTEHFDLCLIEYYIPAWYAFKQRFGCAFISFVCTEAINKQNEMLGNAHNPVLYPDSCVGMPIYEDFFSRVKNFLLWVVMNAYIDYSLNLECDKVVEEHFGEGYRRVGELTKEVDMLFSNTNKVIGTVRPFSLSTVSIGGGMHIEVEKKLPKDLKEFMDKSEKGVILVSFGSNVHSAQLSIDVQRKLFSVFEDLPYDILWKFEATNVTNTPKNVKLVEWIPQQDLLRHKNVKLFITHAGLQSCEEGLIFKVPMLAIPFFADQPYNAYQIVKKGIGLTIDDLEAVTAEELKEAILELINNNKYVKNLEILADISGDEPMGPLEKAVWWTEYVLRHKGAKHLHGPTIPFYQHYMLDIFTFFIVLTLVLILLAYIIVKYMFKTVLSLFTRKKLKQQ